jgi:hypothetical protein
VSVSFISAIEVTSFLTLQSNFILKYLIRHPTLSSSIPTPSTRPHREEAAGQTVGYSEELGSARSTLDSLREQLAMWQQKCNDAEMGIRELRKQLSTTATQVGEEC